MRGGEEAHNVLRRRRNAAGSRANRRDLREVHRRRFGATVWTVERARESNLPRKIEVTSPRIARDRSAEGRTCAGRRRRAVCRRQQAVKSCRIWE